MTKFCAISFRESYEITSEREIPSAIQQLSSKKLPQSSRNLQANLKQELVSIIQNYYARRKVESIDRPDTRAAGCMRGLPDTPRERARFSFRRRCSPTNTRSVVICRPSVLTRNANTPLLSSRRAHRGESVRSPSRLSFSPAAFPDASSEGRHTMSCSSRAHRQTLSPRRPPWGRPTLLRKRSI